MLTVICACRFTRLGLEHLLAPLAPAFLPAASPEGGLPGTPFLLVVATPGSGLPDLLLTFETARRAGVAHLALLGTPLQAMLLLACGVGLSLMLPVKMDPAALHRQVAAWLTAARHRPLRQPWRLTGAERNVLLATLSGISVPRLSDITGRSAKTLYCHRRSALRKLGLRKIHELLAPKKCASLLTGLGRIHGRNPAGSSSPLMVKQK